MSFGAARARNHHARRHRLRVSQESIMTHHVLDMPITDAQTRALKVGDTVTLEKTLYGIRDATLIAMFDRGRTTRFDLKGHAVIHTAPNVRKVDPRPGNSCGYEPLCIGTTTSMRMERFTKPLMQKNGVKLIIGKGGMGPATLKAFKEFGGAYLAVVGGAAALETTWIPEIEDVDMDDLHPESLWKFRIKGFGPLLVTMDSHGGSLHAQVNAEAAARRAAVLASIGSA
jgi:L(+)-tartrate dehydratase beta subunit